jgi:hypothetical protein
LLPFLEIKRQEIENLLGLELNWNPNPENRDKVISITKEIDFSNESDYEEAIDWLVDYTIKFREVFSRNIRESR